MGGALFAQPSSPGIGYLVYDMQDSEEEDVLYTFDFETGAVTPVKSTGYDNVNALAYYCDDACREECSLYALQTSREVSVMPPAIPEVQLLKFDLQGNATPLGILEAPPPIPGGAFPIIPLESAVNFIGAASTNGTYYLTGLSVKFNLLTSELVEAKCYIGEIDLDNIEMNDDGEIEVEWNEIVVNDDYCQSLIDDFISQAISSVNPLQSSISGGIQDFALSVQEDALVSFLGFENAFMSIDLGSYEATCFEGPESNEVLDYTGFDGVRTSEMGGIFRDANGLLYAHQVDDGRIFLVDEMTGELTLVEENLPKDQRGDAASAKFAASNDVACNDQVNITLDGDCSVTVTPDMVAEGKVCNDPGLFKVIVYDGDQDPDDVVDRIGLWSYDLYYRPYPYSDEFVLLCEGTIKAEDKQAPDIYCPPSVVGLRKYKDDDGEYQFTPYRLKRKFYTGYPDDCDEFEEWFEDDDGFNSEGSVFNRLVCDDIDKVLEVEASWNDPDYEYYTGVAKAFDACSGEIRRPVKVEDYLERRECDYSERYDYGRAAAVLYRTFYFEDNKGNQESCTQRIVFFRPYINLPVCKVHVNACEFDGEISTDDLLDNDPYAVPFYVNGVCDTIYLTPDPSESGTYTTKGHTCDYTISYTDQVFPGPEDCGNKVIRKWAILDWCWNPSLGEYPQLLGRPMHDERDDRYACYDFEDDWDEALEMTRKSVGKGKWNDKKFTWEQHIIFADEERPVVTCLGDDQDWDGEYDDDHDVITVSTGPFNCTALIDLEDRIKVTDNCSVKRVRIKLEGFRKDPKTGLDIPVSYGWTQWNEYILTGVPTGTYSLIVEAEDNCGNVGRLTEEDGCTVVVEDQVAPVAICNDDLNVSIGGPGTTADGLARVTAENADEGSWDDCGLEELNVRRAVEDECVDLYLDQVEGIASLAALTAVERAAMGNQALLDEYPGAEVFYFNGAPAAGAPLVLLLEEDAVFYTIWADAVFFTCCDISVDENDKVTIELRATDQSGNSNVCWLNTLVEDKLPPSCDVHNKSILCTDLDFDPTDQEQVAGRFGAPEEVVDTRDNCGATITEEVIWEPDRCGTGVIERVFTITDPSGRSTICTQEIEVEQVNDYAITFPGDDGSVLCGVEPERDISTQNFACDILAVSRDTTFFEASGDECFKLLITHRVINWCEYDGRRNQPIEVPRDWDEDNDLEEDHVIRVASLPAQDLLEEVDGVQVVTWTQEDGDLAWINEADYSSNGPQIPVFTDKGKIYYVARTPGFWQYSQLIKVYDNEAPELEVENESLSFCAYGTPPDDCDGNINITFTVIDECTPDDTEVRSLRLDAFNEGDPRDLSGVLGYRLTRIDDKTYRISGKLPVGEHTFVVSAADGCGNLDGERIPFEVVDCKSPAPICKQTLSVDLMPVDLDDDGQVDGGMNEVWASDFIASPIDDCSPFDIPENVKYFVFKDSDLESGVSSITLDMLNEENSSVIFTCENLGTEVVYVVALDAAGNFDHCAAAAVVQPGVSPSPCGDVEGEGLIAGIITDEEIAPVAGVDVQLSGQASMGYLTDNDGLFDFSNLIEGYDYSVTPDKDYDYLNGVSTYDLVLISKHILRVKELDSPYKLIAADANNSGSVTTLDLIHIRKLILSIASGFPNNTSWRFIPADFEFQNEQNPFLNGFPEFININDLQGAITDADFIAVKVGDVNGSASTNDLLSVDTRSAKFELLAQDIDLKPGETYTVDFTVADLASIQGYQFTLHYDPGMVEFVDLLKGVASEEHFGVFPARGMLTTSWHPAEFKNSLPGEARLFSLVLKAKGEAALSKALRISSALTPAEAYSISDETMGVTLNFGEGNSSGTGFELYQNEPNPVAGQTTIGFQLPEGTRASIRISDVTGRLLKTIEGEFSRGYNEIRLQRSELPATGVLTYTIQTDRHTATRKMIVTQR